MAIDRTYNIYQRIWSLLNTQQRSLVEETIDKENFPTPSSSNYLDLIDFFKTDPGEKIICIKPSLQIPENIDYLTSLNYSPDYLLQNFTKRVGLATHDVREFQNRAVLKRYVYAICPITGEVLRSNQSIPISQGVLFYRFVGAKVFYLVTGNLGQGYPKDALYFPEDNLVVRIDIHRYGIYPEHLSILKAIVVSQYQHFLKYFSDEENRKIAVFMGHPNFAHHLWNELSALYRLQNKNLLQKIDKFFIFRETLGALYEIFPKISEDKICYVDNYHSSDESHQSLIRKFVPVSDKLISDIVSNNYFLIHIGDNFIHHQLTKYIYSVAKQKTDSNSQQIIKEAKAKCFPLIWISVRNQDRTLRDQKNTFVKVINSLSEKYPNLGIVFDGFSLPSDIDTADGRYELSPQQIRMIDAEKDLVQQIVDNLKPNVSVFNNIGRSMFVANLWAHSVDLYLTHFGTLQHKVAWFAIKPGVVHTNARNSSSQKSRYRCYKVREFGIEPKFFTADEIKTLPLAMSQNDLRTNIDNYDIDCQAIYDKLIEVIDTVEESMTLRGKLQRYYQFAKEYTMSRIMQMPYIKRYIYFLHN